MHRPESTWWTITFALAAAVTVATLLPAGAPGPAPSGFVGLRVAGLAIGVDKVLHAAGFLAITVSGGSAVGGRDALEAHRGLLLVAALALVLGAGTELAQSVVPGRTPDVLDFVADVVGIVAGLVVHAARVGWRR